MLVNKQRFIESKTKKMKKSIFILGMLTLIHAGLSAQLINQPDAGANRTAINRPVTRTENAFSNFTYLPGSNDPEKGYDFYNRKSRNQRITGLSLLGGGLLLGGAGILFASSNSSNYESDGQTAAVFFVASAAAGLASIPFMILAHASKNKARAALSNQKTFIPGKQDKYITGFTISIPVGK